MTNIIWPKNLVSALSEGRAVLFIGAGFSMGSKNKNGEHPPSWGTLLDSLGKEYLRSKKQKKIFNKIAKTDPLEAAEMIHYYARNESNEITYKEYISELTNGAPGNPFATNEWHDTLKSLEVSVNMIITTNYDSLLEVALDPPASGYKVFDYKQKGISEYVRQNKLVILKLHGTYASPDGIMLSRSDYSEAKIHGAEAYKVVEALMMTRPCLFLGYSLNDPDIQLLLENVRSPFINQSSHYILISHIDKYREKLLNRVYGVKSIIYGPSHDAGLEAFRGLVDEVNLYKRN